MNSASPPPPTASNVPLVRLKNRAQFLKLASRGRKAVRKTLVLQAMKLNSADQARARILARQTHLDSAIYLGFTASKKVGNAVARNRAKRRLTAAARDILPTHARPGWGMVLIARAATVAAPFDQIEMDLREAVVAAGAGR